MRRRNFKIESPTREEAAILLEREEQDHQRELQRQAEEDLKNHAAKREALFAAYRRADKRREEKAKREIESRKNRHKPMISRVAVDKWLMRRGSGPDATPFERFQTMMRHIARVPKESLPLKRAK